jgi:hypothetical protein
MLSNFTVKTDYFSIGKDDMAYSKVKYSKIRISHCTINKHFHQIFEFVTMIKSLIFVYTLTTFKESNGISRGLGLGGGGGLNFLEDFSGKIRQNMFTSLKSKVLL